MPILIVDGGGPAYNRFIAIIGLNTLEGSVLNNTISHAKLYIAQNDMVLWEFMSDDTPEIRESARGLEVIFRDGFSSLRNQVVDAILEFESQGNQYRVVDKAKTINVVF